MYILQSKLGEAPSTTPTNCSSVCSGIPEVRFEKQPADLQRVLTQSFQDPREWLKGLDSERCMALASIFNRLCRYRVWNHVRSILRIAAGEPDVVKADLVFKVPGSTPSVYFLSTGGDTLIENLMATGRFCKARGIGASQHPKQTTLREISQSDSLHISVGPGNQFDAHIDRISPVTEHPGSTFCSNLPTAAALSHITSELIPEFVRKYTGVPGVQPVTRFDQPNVAQPEPSTRQDAQPPPPIVTWTIRGPNRSARTRPQASSQANVLLPVDVVTRIDRAIKEQVSPEALLPSQVRARLANARKALEFAGPNEEAPLRRARDIAEREVANYPDPLQLALSLAEQMDQARRANLAWVKINLTEYGSNDFASRKFIAGEIRRIALILRNYLPECSKGVRSIIIIFGSGNVATREEVKLP